jgi:hypothetical protein
MLFDGSVENSNSCILNFVDGSLGVSKDDHAVNNLRVLDSASQNLLNSNVINIESVSFLWHGVKASIGNKTTQEIF